MATELSALPANHPRVSFGKVGVLLVNLGTPDGTDYWPMRRYLAEFLSDKRVIEWSRLYWYPILYGIVLNKRPQKVGKAYEEIWNHERNESYLRTYTRSQGELMAAALKDLPNVVVDWAMRYGQPSIASKIDALEGTRLRKNRALPALSAICRLDHGNRERQGFRASDEAALATGHPHRSALS